MFGSTTQVAVNRLKASIQRSKQLLKSNMIMKGASTATSVGNPMVDLVAAGDGGEFSGEFAPLVALSIDKTWASTLAGNNQIVLTKMLKSKDITSTEHFTTMVRSYGYSDVNPFVTEGRVPAASKSRIERIGTKIKYMAVKREITQQAMHVAIFGGVNGNVPMVDAQGLAFETGQGLREFAVKYEEALWRADSSVYENEFDGVGTQIFRHGVEGLQVHDLRGGLLTLERLVEDISRIAEARDIFASTDTVVVPARVWATMSNAAAPYGRMDVGASGNQMYFNRNQLYVRTPSEKEILIKSAPLIDEAEDVTAGQGTTPAEGFEATPVPTLDSAPVVGVTSLFGAADAGTYNYRLKAYYKKGSASPTASVAATVADADVVAIAIDDLAVSGLDTGTTPLIASAVDNELIYYKLYRTNVGDDAGTEKFIARFSPNTDDTGGDGGTLFYDRNANLPGTGTSYALQTGMDAMYEAKLLGTTRFPLAPTELTQPFAIVKFSSVFIPMVNRQIGYKNVALSS